MANSTCCGKTGCTCGLDKQEVKLLNAYTSRNPEKVLKAVSQVGWATYERCVAQKYIKPFANPEGVKNLIKSRYPTSLN